MPRPSGRRRKVAACRRRRRPALVDLRELRLRVRHDGATAGPACRGAAPRLGVTATRADPPLLLTDGRKRSSRVIGRPKFLIVTLQTLQPFVHKLLAQISTSTSSPSIRQG